MQGVLVDSCVILDIITEDPVWFNWSAEALENAANNEQLFINPIIYSEVSIGYQKIEELEAVLPSNVFVRLNLPWEAAFLAGKAFLKYRKAGGARSLPLPDFFIGAHAMVSQLQLLTRDPRKFKNYYPKIDIISPKSHK
ncbi:MAG: type II toxin-antitoxin system VapC family toxin [Legionellales bacterium]|jgi:hypothetical protein